MSGKAQGVRARVRAELTGEIKSIARQQLSRDGANLSLRAVARELGMVSSAVYRYFATRDELLTALIVDAYNAVGQAAEDAAAARSGPDHLGRWLAVATAVRDWALAEPHQWALIHGSPVPGYRAPADTVEPGVRVTMLIGQVLLAAHRAGALADVTPLTGRYADELARVAGALGTDVPARLVASTFAMYFQLCGAISAEVFGQLANSVDEDRAGFFEFQMRGAATIAGLS